MKLQFTLILFFLLLFSFTKAQDTIRIDDVHVLYRVVEDGDTMYLASLKEVFIFPQHNFKSKRDMRRYRRLIYNVKKAYPYAILASKTIKEIDENIGKLKTEKARKDYLKKMEKQLFDRYEDELKKLTITQGRILIKLIDRETGDTSYDLVKDFRGKFSAFLWQTIARLFGTDLKAEFDPQGEDRLINEIVILIENGQL
ncbi:MAG: DUF4294 domain-containing protein [Bacteroidales bacterium]|nr:DUF4294 domain-containing protein [Bacteroidales bacterium]